MHLAGGIFLENILSYTIYDFLDEKEIKHIGLAKILKKSAQECQQIKTNYKYTKITIKILKKNKNIKEKICPYLLRFYRSNI